MKQKLAFSFLFVISILISSCSNESSESSKDEILEWINLVCEGENTFKRNYEWQFTEPEKKVYRFNRTANGYNLYGFYPGPKPNFYSVNIDVEKISLLWESEKDDDGWFHYQSIKINRFTGEVEDWWVHQTSMNMDHKFIGTCVAQDQKF